MNEILRRLKIQKFITKYTTVYHWTSTYPELSNSQITQYVLILSSHRSLSHLMVSLSHFLIQNLLTFMNYTRLWKESSTKCSIGLAVCIGDSLLCSSVSVEERNVITVSTELCYTCENSYMFRLYKCSLHQALHGNWNKHLQESDRVQSVILIIFKIFLFNFFIQPDECYICIV